MRMDSAASTMCTKNIICMTIISFFLSTVYGQFSRQTLSEYKGLDNSLDPILSEVIRRMDELEHQHNVDKRILSEVISRLSYLETRHIRDAQQVAEMTSNIDELKTENELLQKKLGMLTKLLPGTQWSKDPNNGEESKIRKVAKAEKNGDIRTDKGSANSKMNKELRDTPTDAPDTIVAFYAILAHEIPNVSQDIPLMFENVVTNVGGQFNKFTGTFTSLQAGLYAFYWTVKSDYNSWIVSELVRNGSVLGTDISAYPNSGSSTAIVLLETGDRIWVRISSKMEGTEIQPIFTTFSGFLIQST